MAKKDKYDKPSLVDDYILAMLRNLKAAKSKVKSDWSKIKGRYKKKSKPAGTSKTVRTRAVESKVPMEDMPSRKLARQRKNKKK